jgi:hypothetical protein
MYQTTYHRPSSVDEAAAAFAKGSDSKYLAGGHTLIPVMKQRLAAPSDVIDLGKIKELVGIESSGDTLTIKAATTYFDIMQSADVKKSIPAIAYLTSVLGDPAVRYRGTIGGSIANNDPAADFPAALVSLGATVKTNKRSIAADDFFKGLFTTALEDGGLVPRSGQGGLCQDAASGIALRADRRVRDQDQGRRRPRRGNGRVAERRDAGAGDRDGVESELVGQGARQRQDFGQWHDRRHPRHVGLPRQPGQGHGAACRRGRWLTASVWTQLSLERRAAMRAAFTF